MRTSFVSRASSIVGGTLLGGSNRPKPLLSSSPPPAGIVSPDSVVEAPEGGRMSSTSFLDCMHPTAARRDRPAVRADREGSQAGQQASTTNLASMGWCVVSRVGTSLKDNQTAAQSTSMRYLGRREAGTLMRRAAKAGGGATCSATHWCLLVRVLHNKLSLRSIASHY